MGQARTADPRGTLHRPATVDRWGGVDRQGTGQRQGTGHRQGTASTEPPGPPAARPAPSLAAELRSSLLLLALLVLVVAGTVLIVDLITAGVRL